MKHYLKNITAVCFLMLMFPCTLTLLINGKHGIHREEQLSDMDYKILYELMQEDVSWMEDSTLELLAILLRTECMRVGNVSDGEIKSVSPYEDLYERAYDAVWNTRGQVVVIDGEYRELPYHAVSAGSTRKGTLLGEEYSYVRSVDCPEDLRSEAYLKICYLSKEELKNVLGTDIFFETPGIKRDEKEYVTEVTGAESTWPGEQIRTILHLPSSCFWTEVQEDRVRFTVKGVGHGFGISLYTANQMIRGGADREDIFQMFYEGAECITIP